MDATADWSEVGHKCERRGWKNSAASRPAQTQVLERQGMSENQLSTQGQQRRNEILALVLAESSRLQRRKYRLRLCGLAAMLLVAAGVVCTYRSAELTPDRNQIVHPRDGISSSPRSFDLKNYVAGKEVGDLGQYLVETREDLPQDILLDDTELLTALADHGRVEGIVRVGGKTWLTSEFDSRPQAWK